MQCNYLNVYYNFTRSGYTVETNMTFRGVCEILQKYMIEKNTDILSLTALSGTYKVLLNWFIDEDVLSVYSENTDLEEFIVRRVDRDLNIGGRDGNSY